MYYDSVYKNNPNFCGQKPNKLLIEVFKKSPKGKEALDLGCGQGRDSFYLARKKFHVTAVDNSKVAIFQIKEEAARKKIGNIEAICQNIARYEIKPNKFNIINIIGTLHFLPKKDSLAVIEKIKKAILPGGFIIITSFTSDNPPSKRRKFHFRPGELKKLFPESKFRIYHYLENTYFDKGHIGQPEPHTHGMVGIIAQKI